VSAHAFLERMFVGAALKDPGWGDIAIAKYEPGLFDLYSRAEALRPRSSKRRDARQHFTHSLG
jgi:hypothetical protein